MDEIKFVFSEILLSDEQLKAIGCLALESTQLDIYIGSIIDDVCKFDEKRSEVFVGQLMIGAKAKVMRDLLWPSVVGTEHEAKFQLIYGEIQDLIAKRNDAIHGKWDAKGAGFYELAFRLSVPVAQRKGKATSIKATEVMDLVFRFERCRNELLEWYRKYMGSSPPSPGKSS